MHRFKELTVWQRPVDLAVDIYKSTKSFPESEKFSLTSQLRRSAVSVTSNVAEGAGRNSDNEFYHFLGISNGSSNELETQLIISNKLELLSTDSLDKFSKQINEIQNMIAGLQRNLKSK